MKNELPGDNGARKRVSPEDRSSAGEIEGRRAALRTY